MLSPNRDYGMDTDLLDVERALRTLVPVQPAFSRDQFFFRVGYAAGQSTGSLWKKLLSFIRTTSAGAGRLLRD
jgi:hypothetical protein